MQLISEYGRGPVKEALVNPKVLNWVIPPKISGSEPVQYELESRYSCVSCVSAAYEVGTVENREVPKFREVKVLPAAANEAGALPVNRQTPKLTDCSLVRFCKRSGKVPLKPDPAKFKACKLVKYRMELGKLPFRLRLFEIRNVSRLVRLTKTSSFKLPTKLLLLPKLRLLTDPLLRHVIPAHRLMHGSVARFHFVFQFVPLVEA